MASAKHSKASLLSHAGGDGGRFFPVAVKIAAHEESWATASSTRHCVGLSTMPGVGEERLLRLALPVGLPVGMMRLLPLASPS